MEFEYPETDTVAGMVTEHGPNLMYDSVDLDPVLRGPEGRAAPAKLATLDAWVAGLRREQWRSRRNIAKVELDREHGGIVKLNPVADWTLDRMWDYVREHDVPYHALFDQGYTSIGCAPCTRAVAPGESERAGRWWWEQATDKECGIHCSVGLLGSASGIGSEQPRPLPRRRRDELRLPGDAGAAGRRCVVIGAQAIREGKVEGCSWPARTTSWSSIRTSRTGFEDDRGGDGRARAWRPADLDGAFLGDRFVGRRRHARRDRPGGTARGALVNVVDDIPNCDWAAPAVVRRGDLVLAIGTGGASPPPHG